MSQYNNSYQLSGGYDVPDTFKHVLCVQISSIIIIG